MKKSIILILLFVVISGLIYLISSNRTKLSSLSNLPPPPPDFKYKIVGAKQAKLSINYGYENSYYDYSYEVDLDNETKGEISVVSSPEGENVQITIIAVSETGGKSKPLIFETKQWYKRIYYKLIGHTFVIEN